MTRFEFPGIEAVFHRELKALIKNFVVKQVLAMRAHIGVRFSLFYKSEAVGFFGSCDKPITEGFAGNNLGRQSGAGSKKKKEDNLLHDRPRQLSIEKERDTWRAAFWGRNDPPT